MRITELNSIDLRLKLIAGDSFFVGNVELKPLTLREIKDIGYSKYNQNLSIMTYRVEDLVGAENVDKIKGLTLLDVVMYSENDELINAFLGGLCTFLKEDINVVKFHEEYGLVFGDTNGDLKDTKCVNGKNFEEIVEVVKFQNCINSATDETYNPANEKAKSIIEKLKKAKDKVMKSKAADGEDNNIDFADLVSAVSTKSNSYDKRTIWDLTMYQFYDEYKRLELIGSYETSIRAMIAGAQVDLKHWSAKI